MLTAEMIAGVSDQPGVYIMYNAQGRTLYIGKAKALKTRLRSYLREGGDGRVAIPYLQEETTQVETIVVAHEVEALLLENNLIKRYQPKYNLLLKDDTYYMAFHLRSDHPWPKLEMVRHRAGSPGRGEWFGPYSAFAAYQLEEFVHNHFPLRRCSDHELTHRLRPCILHGMGRCLAPCVGKPEGYAEGVSQVRELFQGQGTGLVDHFDKEIAKASEALEFERAQKLLETQRKLKGFLQPQSVHLPIETSGELLHLEWGANRSRPKACLGRVSIRQGRVIDVQVQQFDLYEEGQSQQEDHWLLSLAMQHLASLGEEAAKIETLWVDLPPAMQELLQEAARHYAPKLVCRLPRTSAQETPWVEQWRELARRNCVERLRHTDKKPMASYEQLTQLQDSLQLENLPVWIECIDSSHHGGKEHVVSSVAYRQGHADPSLYRHYRVHNPVGGDDYGALQEALKRRFQRAQEEGEWMTLLLIDGGSAHLEAAQRIAQQYQLPGLELAAISKDKGRHSRSLNQEVIHRPGRVELRFHHSNPALQLLQRIRDEAHRRALAYHHKRYRQNAFKSCLDDLPGIGAKKRAALLAHFGSVAALKDAKEQELLKVPGLTRRDRELLKERVLGFGEGEAKTSSGE